MVEESTASVQEMISSIDNVAKVSRAKGEASRNLLVSAGSGREQLTVSVDTVERIGKQVGAIVGDIRSAVDISRPLRKLSPVRQNSRPAGNRFSTQWQY